MIFFLNDMVDDGVLGFTEATGKGGHHKVYNPKMDESGYRRYLLRTVIESMIRGFQEETRKVLKEYS